jgi:hypothetical protein
MKEVLMYRHYSDAEAVRHHVASYSNLNESQARHPTWHWPNRSCVTTGNRINCLPSPMPVFWISPIWWQRVIPVLRLPSGIIP